jgi:PAS domain S-box-containing protein
MGDSVFFQQLCCTSRTVVWRIDSKGLYTYISPVVEDLLGYKPEELIGKYHYYELCPENERATLFAESMEIINRKQAFRNLENCAIARNGETIWMSTSGLPILNDRGELLGYEGWDVDITDRKQLEVQLLRSQRMESIGTMAGGIAHNINNMLAPIMMAVDLMKPQAKPKEEKLFSIIQESARRGADLVQQILSFARGVEGLKVEVDIAEIVNATGDIVRETFPNTIQLEIEVADKLIPVKADPTQIQQVLLNLCVNARDAMPTGGTLKLYAHERYCSENVVSQHEGAAPGTYAVIEISDTGEGIPPAVINRIFDPFFTTKGIGKGTGLGLPSSLAIVRGHQGFIEVTSRHGKGSRFVVFLPVKTEPDPSRKMTTDDSIKYGKGERILVVDDEMGILEMTRLVLESYGYRVTACQSSGEALRLLNDHPKSYDLILTDLMMPDMDGAALIKQIPPFYEGVPVIIMSALGHPGALHDLPRNHSYPILAKPYNSRTLLNTLSQVLK